jgi:hypothetical protein
MSWPRGDITDNVGRARHRVWSPYESPVKPSLWLDATRRDTITTVVTSTGVNTSGSASAGATSVTSASTLVGQLVSGMIVTFGAAGDEYVVSGVTSTTVTFAPGLAATVSSGSAINRLNISDWDDLSGNAVSTTQGTAGNQPFYGTNAINGLAAVYGLGDTYARYMTTATPAGSYTVFAALTISGNCTLIGGNTNLTNIQIRALSNHWEILKQNVANYLTGTNTFTTDVPHILSAVSASGDNRLGINASVETSATTFTAYAAGNALFRRASATFNYFNGRLGEMVIYNAILSQTEIDKNIGYLAHKWGLEEPLVAGTPYKQAPPIR